MCKEIESYNLDLYFISKILENSMSYYKGIGISASQMGLPIKLFIMRDNTLCANCTITHISRQKIIYNEGCLSFKNRSHALSRHKYLKIIYSSYYNNPMIIELYNGIFTSCIQHEKDHTNGITYICRAVNTKN